MPLTLVSVLQSTGMATRLLAGLAALAGLVAALWWAWRSAGEPDARLVYKQVAGHSLQLHVFHARGWAASVIKQPPAALLLFHGGGWAHGHASQFYPQCRLLSQQGITCISVEYRVASRHASTPADAVDDAQDALRWVRRHAGTLHIDDQRVAAGGGSAGGHLAAALGVGLRQTDARTAAQGADATGAGARQQPAALLLLNPMLDLSPGQPDHTLVAPDWHAMSPLHHVAPGVPPTLVLSGTDDPEVPVHTVQAFCERLRRSASLCELQLFHGGRHGFFNPQVDEGRHYLPALDSMRGFLQRQGLL